MEREPVDVLLSRPATLQQRAWLDTTRVPLRSIGLPPPSIEAPGEPAVPDMAALIITVTHRMLEASTRTLEVTLCKVFYQYSSL